MQKVIFLGVGEAISREPILLIVDFNAALFGLLSDVKIAALFRL